MPYPIPTQIMHKKSFHTQNNVTFRIYSVIFSIFKIFECFGTLFIVF